VRVPRAKTAAAAEPADLFPALRLPVRPPLPPMEAKAVARLPAGGGWLYEPKWDGFRCLVFRSGAQVVLQSKSCQPLGRYFPELVAAFAALPVRRFVLDGEIVVAGGAGLDFDALLQRIHPAASRIARLARETPASFHGFDLLVDERGKSWMGEALAARREQLERFFAALPAGPSAGTSRGASQTGVNLPSACLHLSPASRDRRQAERWLEKPAALGLDGVMAKVLDSPYLPGERTAMVKVKRAKTADCVVGGFRWAQAGGKLGSLLLGLYDEQGLLDHAGFCASFDDAERREIERLVVPLVEPPGFTGRAPGGPSRWSQGRSTDWEPLRPVLVCEVRYDHFSGGRFRHGTKFLRWRRDKEPRQCTFDQVMPARTARHTRGRAAPKRLV
jgi:ATP-dependent DNA ligase